MLFFTQQLKNLRRLREILRVFVKYGFEDMVINTPLKALIPKRRLDAWIREDKPIENVTRWERIRMVAEELGPTFVKGAQVLSNRPDILPEDLIVEFKKLQSNVAAFPWEQAKAIIERELGRSIEEVFAEFRETPIGAASIGQVYRARLRTGEEVVVKVQRPEVAERITTDLELLKEIARRSAGYLQRNGVMDPMDVIKSFERTMSKELQYTVEARNIEQFRNYYKNNKEFYVPKTFREYSTDKILVIEFVAGCKITDVAQLKAWGISPENIAERGFHLYLTQIFEHGYFHADPHPGNIFVQQSGRICLIDFGMVGTMLPRERRAFAEVFLAMAQRDPESMARALKKLATDEEIEDINSLIFDLNELVEDYSSLDAQQSSMADMSVRFQRIVYDYRMKVPGAVFLIFRALAILEGIGKEIHPNLNIYESVRPFGIKILREQYSPTTLAKEGLMLASDFNGFLQQLPTELREILKKIRKGRLTVVMESPELHALVERLGYAGDRITSSIVATGLIIGASLLPLAERSDVPLSIRGLPTLSWVGYALAGWIMLRLWFGKK